MFNPYTQFLGVLETCLALRYWFFRCLAVKVLRVLCDYISAFKRETDMGFMVLIMIIRFIPSLFCHC